jgi:hypothetical protein
MKFKSLSIGIPEWGKDKDKMIGKITFNNMDAEVTLNLSEERSQEMLAIVANAIVDNAREISQILTTEMTSKLIEEATE